jgi:hypothetical protein
VDRIHTRCFPTHLQPARVIPYMIRLPPQTLLMIERLDCISVFRDLLSITYLRARLHATHNPHSIPHTIRRVYLPSAFLPFTDQDSLSTEKRPMDFPLPIFSVCAHSIWFLQPLISCGLGTTADCFRFPPPAYIVCDA